MVKISLKSRAIKYLSLREHSIKELKTKLAKYTIDTNELQQTIDWLINKGYLSEERYTDSFLLSKAKKYGSLKLKHLLEQKLVDKSLIKEKLQTYSVNEIDTIINLWHKRYGEQVFEEMNTELQQKIIRWLLNKGFNYDIIKQAIKILQQNKMEE